MTPLNRRSLLGPGAGRVGARGIWKNVYIITRLRLNKLLDAG